MKFRIIYKDKWGNEKSLIYESASWYTASKFAKHAFKDKFVSIENVDKSPAPAENKYSYVDMDTDDFDDFDHFHD